MKNVVQTKRTKVKDDGTIVELVPPEGGWGYMICVSFIIVFISAFGPHSNYGLIYNDFLESMHLGTSVVTTMQSVVTASVSIAATLTAAALKRFSIRQMALLGAFVGTLSAFLSIFVSSVYEMILYATIHAFSTGITLPIMYTSLNSYFVERRVYVMSICKCFVAALMMAYPFMIEYFMENYGFRGTLALICSIVANYFVGALLMQPVEKHFVEKTISITNFEDDFTDKADDTAKSKNHTAMHNIKYDPCIEKLLVVSSAREASTSPTLMEVMVDRVKSKECETEKMDVTLAKTLLENDLKAISLSSIGNCEIAFVEMNVKSNGKLQTIAKILDLDLLKNWAFVNICMGLSFSFFSDMSFTILLPFMLFYNKFNKEEVAVCLSMMAAGDFAARIILIFVSRKIKLKPRNVFYFGVIVSFAIRIAFNFTSNFYTVVFLVFVNGMSKCILHMMTPLTLADHVRLEQFPGALALHTVSNGIISAILAPVVGLIRDITGSYNIAFSILTGAFLICIIPWTIEFVIMKRRKIK